MQQEFQIRVNPEVAQNNEQLKLLIAKKNKFKVGDIKHLEILKRSIDARQKNIKINLKVKVFINEVFVKVR